MEKSKKNGTLRFICSLLPGAGEMYMGFMKMGVSIMILFFIMCSLTELLGSEIFVALSVVVWCYSFFRVHNLASMPEERLKVYHDDYIFSDSSKYGDVFSTGNKFYKIEAAVLIFLGTLMCIKGVYRSVVNYIPAEYQGIINQVVDMLPRLIVGILIIALGIWMIRGKKKELDSSDNLEINDYAGTERNAAGVASSDYADALVKTGSTNNADSLVKTGSTDDAGLSVKKDSIDSTDGRQA